MDEELDELNLEEIKRRRSGPHTIMDTSNVNVTTHKDTWFSSSDYTKSSPEFLATIARQASQLK